MMKTLVLSALALGALTTTALAEPVTTAAATGPIALTDAEMDKITAGQLVVQLVLLAPTDGTFKWFAGTR